MYNIENDEVFQEAVGTTYVNIPQWVKDIHEKIQQLPEDERQDKLKKIKQTPAFKQLLKINKSSMVDFDNAYASIGAVGRAGEKVVETGKKVGDRVATTGKGIGSAVKNAYSANKKTKEEYKKNKNKINETYKEDLTTKRESLNDQQKKYKEAEKNRKSIEKEYNEAGDKNKKYVELKAKLEGIKDDIENGRKLNKKDLAILRTNDNTKNIYNTYNDFIADDTKDTNEKNNILNALDSTIKQIEKRITEIHVEKLNTSKTQNKDNAIQNANNAKKELETKQKEYDDTNTKKSDAMHDANKKLRNAKIENDINGVKGVVKSVASMFKKNKDDESSENTSPASTSASNNSGSTANKSKVEMDSIELPSNVYESYIYNYALIHGYDIENVLEAAYDASNEFFANDTSFKDLDPVEYNIITEFCRIVPVSVLQSFGDINPYKVDVYNNIIETKEATEAYEEELYSEAVTDADKDAFAKFASGIKKAISEIFNVSGLKEKNGNLMFKISDKNSDTGLGNYLTVSLQEKNGQIKTIKHFIDDTSNDVGVPEEVDELSGKFLSSGARSLLEKFINFLSGGPKVVFAEYYDNIEDSYDFDLFKEAFSLFAVNRKVEPEYNIYDDDHELDDDMYNEGFNFLFGKKNKESTTKDDTLSTIADNNNVTLEDVEKRFNFTFPEDFKNGYTSPEFQEKLNAKGLIIKLGETVNGNNEVRVKLYHPNEFRMTQNYAGTDNPQYVPFGEFIDDSDNNTLLVVDIGTGEIGTLTNGEFESQCNSFDQFEKNIAIASTPNFDDSVELDDDEDNTSDNNDSIDIDDSIDTNPEGNDTDDSDIGIDLDDDSSDNNDTDTDMSVGDDNSFDAPANEDTTATEYFFDDEDDDLYEEFFGFGKKKLGKIDVGKMAENKGMAKLANTNVYDDSTGIVAKIKEWKNSLAESRREKMIENFRQMRKELTSIQRQKEMLDIYSIGRGNIYADRIKELDDRFDKILNKLNDKSNKYGKEYLKLFYKHIDNGQAKKSTIDSVKALESDLSELIRIFEEPSSETKK